LAGIFDGEGSISIGHSVMRQPSTAVPWHRYYLSANVMMKHKATVDLFWHFFGGRMSERRSSAKQRRDGLFDWSAKDWWARHCLEALQPFLRIKHVQAELGLRFMVEAKPLAGWDRSRPIGEETVVFRHSFYEQMGELNQSCWWKKRHGLFHQTTD
jgi:hypothetical protein